MAATEKLQFFCGRKNSNLMSEIIQIVQLYSQRFGDVLVVFLMFYQNSKCPPLMNFIIFVGTKTQVRNYLNFTITFPTIWRCAGDFFKILLKFKMAVMDEPWISQSHYPPS